MAWSFGCSRTISPGQLSTSPCRWGLGWGVLGVQGGTQWEGGAWGGLGLRVMGWGPCAGLRHGACVLALMEVDLYESVGVCGSGERR